MIALCNNDPQNVSVVAIPTFFIPSSLNERQFSGLPLSKDLSFALKRLGIKSLEDLNGISQKDFQSVSGRSSALVVELFELIQKLRDAQLPPDNSLEPVNQDATESTQTCLPQKIQRGDAIAIPEEVRGHSLSNFPMSVRLANVLELKYIRLLGDLHGLTYGEIRTYRNCWRKTVDELRALVGEICAGKQISVTTSLEAAVRAGYFSIPTNANELNPFDLPLSPRLENVLEQKGIKRLGDLTDISVHELLQANNCGRKTINELDRILVRARSGDFDLPQILDARFFAEHVDTFFSQLKTSERNTVVLRYGGTTAVSLTLEEIGK